MVDNPHAVWSEQAQSICVLPPASIRKVSLNMQEVANDTRASLSQMTEIYEFTGSYGAVCIHLDREEVEKQKRMV